ncbi:MAG: glutamine--fructose-6-phosphate transaminase (isomerizing) [Spirochaetales bacterium]|jgi:glutamine---fructose-6-phosphate transaminase (isomerizing)|nr:glutamine--fructose-6-phosphate transaminase (isomerizing) [Spirochaetales bacterium]
MCGIVGYIGKKEAQDILFEGLRKLEYRGYDSSGICIANNNKLYTEKAAGKLKELGSILAVSPLKGSTGIAHTRWATHGEPTKKNAHPHSSNDGNFSVVHNGIIENFAELKKVLISEGTTFLSDTDTEVIVHLVAKNYSGNLREAVLHTIAQLEGAFGIAVVCAQEPNTLIGARKGSPLVVGISEDGYYLGSDALALGSEAKEMIYLDDNDVVELKGDSYKIVNLANAEVNRKIENVDQEMQNISKGDFDHFMLKEIYEQVDTIKNAMRGRLLMDQGSARLDGLNMVLPELRNIKRIIIIGCGTSFYAGLVGEYVMENLSGISVEVEYASEFRYRNPIVEPDTLVFAISQSGETADTLAALREAKIKGATVLGICNTVGSTIARETDGGIYLHAGREIGVASTKAFTSQVTVLIMLSLMLGRMRRIQPERGIEICEALIQIPSLIAETLKQNDKIREIANEYSDASNFLYLGRGYNYPVALEGALKLKEISYLHAEGYPAAEMKHGPIALVDENMPTVVIAPSGPLFEKVVSNMEEVRARKGRIIAITDIESKKLSKLADHIITVPQTQHILMPLLTVVPLQLLAYHIAVIKGCDVDHPRNLAKSVTVE